MSSRKQDRKQIQSKRQKSSPQKGQSSPQRSRQKPHRNNNIKHSPIIHNSHPVSVIDKQLKQQQKQNKQQSDIDMFADDINQSNSPNNNNNNNSNKKQLKQQPINKQIEITDQTGYYIPIIGNTIGGKYKIIDKLGKGVFGIVIKVQNIQDNNLYAIKIIRKNQMTQASGYRQYKLLQQIHNKYKLKRIMKVFNIFKQQQHLCIVCQILNIDLRSFSHKNQPSLADIRLYAISMFLISHQLRKSKILHADIKPDNFLFTKSPNTLHKTTQQINQRQIIDNIKLADFGTSFSIDQYNNFVQYQVARYYRAPQIILGTKIKKDQVYAIDVWAIGCSLFQLFTNQFLFNGGSNNQMLKLMMETKGKFNLKMLNKSEFREKHFDEDFNFLWGYIDRVTKQRKIQKMQVSITAQRDLMAMLKKYGKVGQSVKDLQNFKDFLQKCLTLNPKDRMTPQQAIQHPFLHYQTKLQN